ncbi:MAG: OsmC family protein [Caldilineaceae bacterium]|nr:OsmC family protein [Caldilineaceae bacterium]
MGQIALQWTGNDSQLFIGRDSFGHVVMSGSWPKEEEGWTEWKALKPSDMLVLSLMSCSGYDVVMILKRQRQQLTGLHITADAEQAAEPPYAFTHIHLHYSLAGHELDADKVARAIALSEEKYCSVAATIKGVTQLTHSYDIQGG